MSPIISFHNETGPPPFSSRRQPPPTRLNAFDPTPSGDAELTSADDGDDELDDGHPYPPSYPLDDPPDPSHRKPKHSSHPNDGYGEYDSREDEADGLLYEMDVLGGGGGRSRDDRPETLSSRRARGEASIGAGAPGWFGVTVPTKAAWREIREMMYEVSQLGRGRPGRVWSERRADHTPPSLRST